MKKKLSMKFNCQELCDSVKVPRRGHHNMKKTVQKFPFVNGDEVFVSKIYPDINMADAYDHDMLDKENRLYFDHENHPDFCKNTECDAPKTNDKDEQRKIVENMIKEN